MRAVLDRVLAQPGFAGPRRLAPRGHLARQGAPTCSWPTRPSTSARPAARGRHPARRHRRHGRRPHELLAHRGARSPAAPRRPCLTAHRSHAPRCAPVSRAQREPGRQRRLRHRRGAVHHPGGLMFYDAQIAGMPDTGTHVRTMKAASARELRTVGPASSRRSPGSRSSRSSTRAERAASTSWRGIRASPASPRARAGLRADTVRRLPRLHAAAPASRTRCRSRGGRRRTSARCSAGATWPRGRCPRPNGSPSGREGLRVLPREGVGEVQTPVTGPAAAGLRVGDRVWWRHARSRGVRAVLRGPSGRRGRVGRHGADVPRGGTGSG